MLKRFSIYSLLDNNPFVIVNTCLYGMFSILFTKFMSFIISWFVVDT